MTCTLCTFTVACSRQVNDRNTMNYFIPICTLIGRCVKMSLIVLQRILCMCGGDDDNNENKIYLLSADRSCFPA